jgi:hypothetical protein
MYVCIPMSFYVMCDIVCVLYDTIAVQSYIIIISYPEPLGYMMMMIIIIIIYLQSLDPIYSHKDKNRMWIWSTAYELISYIIYTLSNKYKQFVKTT